ncbi:polysaccharide pyruvyl transferase family protein [Parasphingorhabdus sp.]|uniref:polysaccharide pyruvyl transferase family protein n=1 Tax=Parasphingorhabdus sp. TaxID=2709688 RepID=UPI0032EC65BC
MDSSQTRIAKPLRYVKFRLRQWRTRRERPALIARAFRRASELATSRKAPSRSALLLPTASPGNLGDDAVFRATVERLLKDDFDPVTIISFSDDELYEIPGAETVVMPLHHSPRGEEYLAFVEELSRYSHYFVWGADIVDGTHGLGVLEPRIVTTNLAARMGVKTNICSFSVSDQRTKAAMVLYHTLDEAVVLQCRDETSAERLREDLPDRSIEVTADLAFMLEPDYSAPISMAAKAWCDARRVEGKILMGVNINDLFCSYFDIPRDDLLRYFADALTDLAVRHPDIAIIHIPHDTHANKTLGKMTDFTLAKQLNALLPEALSMQSFIPEESLSAPEVRAICSYLDLIFSSRMHLSIASLAVGTPVFALAYQGKFEGLFRHFGLEHMFITHNQLSDRALVANFLKSAVERREKVRADISEELPRVKAIANNNLAI